MSKRIVKVLDCDGEFRENPDFPIAVVRESDPGELPIVDPVFNIDVTGNLYGRIMTLVEATCEPHKLKAVKDLFSKELMSWENDVYSSARDLAQGMGATTPGNIYLKGKKIN